MANADGDLAASIKRANRQVYNDMSPEQYNRNESIFNERRRHSCNTILKEAAALSGSDRSLDVGTGTGNLLRLAQTHFDSCYGVDISDAMLARIRPDFPTCGLAASDAENLPFRDGIFNFVSCYALLHHLYEHEAIFRDCFRVLKKGGTLYTDHDPNYYFNRFYRLYYRVKYRNKPGFGSDVEELAEYHNTKSLGIDPERLKAMLVAIGFRKVAVLYRNTDRSEWTGLAAVLVRGLRLLSRAVPAKTFFTHFAIIAVK